MAEPIDFEGELSDWLVERSGLPGQRMSLKSNYMNSLSDSHRSDMN